MEHAAQASAYSQVPGLSMLLRALGEVSGMGCVVAASIGSEKWVACAAYDTIDFGLKPNFVVDLNSMICREVGRSLETVVIDDADSDPYYSTHPAPRLYGFRSSVSTPVFRYGQFYGTLCAYDPRPRALKNSVIPSVFKHYAQLVQLRLEAAQSQPESEEIKSGRLREEFIAVLGHDLRNPLAAIIAAAKILEKGRPDRAASMHKIIQGSANRMARLIENVLDFARGRLGGGIHVHRKPDPELWPLLHQVINELRNANPLRVITDEIDDDGAVMCDRARIGQLLSNLLGNALTHGADTGDITVKAGVTDDVMRITVCNPGEPIPAHIIENLFEPFTGNGVRTASQGLGLGLYIASEIAKAHDGQITVTSTPDSTCFCFAMPAEEPQAVRHS